MLGGPMAKGGKETVPGVPKSSVSRKEEISVAKNSFEQQEQLEDCHRGACAFVHEFDYSPHLLHIFIR